MVMCSWSQDNRPRLTTEAIAHPCTPRGPINETFSAKLEAIKTTLHFKMVCGSPSKIRTSEYCWIRNNNANEKIEKIEALSRYRSEKYASTNSLLKKMQ